MNNKFEIGKEVAIKYIMFKKRTQEEVVKKLEFLNYNSSTIDRIVDYLKEAGYIDDQKYIKKYLSEIKEIKNWSAKQVKSDLFKRGYKGNLDEEELKDYEVKSISNLYNRYKFRYPDHTDEQLSEFTNVLQKKGFAYDNIKKVIREEF